MKDDRPYDSSEKFEKALADAQNAKYVLRLYIAGNTARSAAAIEHIREVCETRLQGRYVLEVIDIYQQPERARGEQILAVPTLIKTLPLPLRRIIGDLSDTERILVGLDLQPVEDDKNDPSNKPL
jgi:circadian clock protein KaiB